MESDSLLMLVIGIAIGGVAGYFMGQRAERRKSGPFKMADYTPGELRTIEQAVVRASERGTPQRYTL